MRMREMPNFVVSQPSVPTAPKFGTQSGQKYGTADVCCVLLGVLVLTLAAQFRIPVPGTPVPGTLHLLAVLVIVLAFRPATGVAATAVYAVAGTLGAPLLTAGSAGLLGVTGGYLCGFVAAAWACGVLRRRMASAGWLRVTVLALLGAGIVLSCGVLWMGFWTGGDWAAAFALAGTPFVLKAAVEAMLASTLVTGLRRVSANRNERSAW